MSLAREPLEKTPRGRVRTGCVHVPGDLLERCYADQTDAR